MSSRLLSVLLLMAALAYVVSAASDDPTQSLDGVADLDSDTFHEQVGKTKAALVEFYAPWCGHCKNLVPEYQRLGQAVKSNKEAAEKILIAKVNAEASYDLGNLYEVKGFPTILYFPAGSTEAVPYKGERDSHAFAAFLSEQTGVKLSVPREASYVVEVNAANFQSIVLDPTKDVLVAFTAPWCGHCKRLKPEFAAVSNIFKDESSVKIVQVNADDEMNKPLANKYNVKGYPSIFFFPKDGKETPVEYRNARDKEAFRTFLNEKCGTHRAADGTLEETVGVIVGLANPVADFVAAVGKGDKAAIAIALEKLKVAIKDVASAGGEVEVYARQYEKIAEKVAELGMSYVEKESSRLERVLAGSIAGVKRNLMTIRHNILQAF